MSITSPDGPSLPVFEAHRAHTRGPLRIRPTYLLLLLFLLVSSMAGEDRKPGEYQVEAVYLFNFGKFVEWPGNLLERNRDPFGICVLGEDPFGEGLDAVISRATVKGKKLSRRRIATYREAAGCHILFISASEDNRLPQILAALGKSSILTVSDLPRFAQRGGMVHFLIDDNRVRFEVNLTATSNAGLVLSSELLKVAVNVIGGPQS